MNFIENKHKRKIKYPPPPWREGWVKQSTRDHKWPLECQEIKLTQRKLDTAQRHDLKQKGVCS